ncbi:unnamed protein product [Linum trigynum]|uniref:BHLH domain-containing protein n=1 Tax=Linum trigynum TaxID=586398 RepID=A0AAV2D603_9ROSI
MGERMDSDAADVHDAVDGTAEVATEKGSRTGRNKAKVPRRVHKAEREKLKREQLNDLFLDLADALELEQPNNGKASILNEAARLLKDLVVQIDALKKENMSLLSESHYVTVEKNELKEENSVLENQIEKLRSEVQTRLAQSKPDLNIPPVEYQQAEITAAALAPHFSGHPAIDGSLQQPPAVFVVPIHPDLSSFQTINKSNVSKPHPRYPTTADSWPSQLLGRREVQVGDSHDNTCNPRE